MMWRTALACCGFAVLACASAEWLTRDFQVWTAEGARRLEVMRHPVAAPAVTVSGPGTKAEPLSGLLADGRSVTIVDFIYTRCQSVCSALGSSFQQLQMRIERDRDALPAHPVRLLSISFDPSHDDAAILAGYAARLQADPRIWRFVAPARTGDLHVLLETYGVVVIPDGMGGYQHNAALLVVDAQGRVTRIFDYDEMDEALGFARSLASTSASG